MGRTIFAFAPLTCVLFVSSGHATLINRGDGLIDVLNVLSVPESGSFVLLGMGLLGLMLARRWSGYRPINYKAKN